MFESGEFVKQRKIRWGILGTGYIAEKFTEALSVLPDAELIGIGSRNIETAREFASRYDIPNPHGSYLDLVNDPEVDVVYVGTLNSLHKENCIQAINAGKAVLCEKPFMLNSREAEEILSLAKEKRVFIMEALWTRFIPAFRNALEMCNSGVLGDVKMLSSDFGFICEDPPDSPLYSPKYGGGSFMDIGYYSVALAHIFLGEPDEISALANVGLSGVDEQMGMLFRYEGGEIGLGFSSFNLETPTEATINGNKGYIRIHSPFYCPSSISLCLNGEEPQVFNFPIEGNGWNYEAVEVMNCLREGKLESDILPHRESLSMSRTMEKFRKHTGLDFSEDKD
jgi:dihydrodiol dehydrogenase / D-xylose 1-dehydrogenase (NADP)